MSLEEYARFQIASGMRLACRRGVFWRPVRPFFYRPLLPFQELDPASLQVPWLAKLGGYQHAVSSGTASNSVLGLLLFPDAPSYCLDTLDKKRRWEVRSAAKHCAVRAITDCQEFKEKAYPVYLSFYARTGYAYLADRSQRESFDCWSETLFAFPSVVKLGAFSGDKLHALSISMAVGETLVYSTFFAIDEALRHNVSSLMLHTVRLGAARSAGVSQVFAGMCKAGENRRVDEFYLQRGCSEIMKPAFYKLNPIAHGLLRLLRPEYMRQIMGTSSSPPSFR